MKVRVGAVFIPVLELEESIKWYSNALELRLIDNWGTGASFSFGNGQAKYLGRQSPVEDREYEDRYLKPMYD